jgi:SAM-dependent methyltransferase
MRFTKKQFAMEYDRRMKNDGYPGNILPLIIEKTKDCESIIDIGAGTGLLTIPLAEWGHRVTAVEPSAPMIELLRRNAAGRCLDSISVEQEYWETWDGNPADCAICVHSAYTLKPLAEALRKMKIKAPRVILVVGDDTGSHTLSGALMSRLSIPLRKRVSASDIRKAIRNLGMSHSEAPIEQYRIHRIEDLHGEAEFYRHSHSMVTLSAGIIADALRDIMSREEGRYTFMSRYADVVFEF